MKKNCGIDVDRFAEGFEIGYEAAGSQNIPGDDRRPASREAVKADTLADLGKWVYDERWTADEKKSFKDGYQDGIDEYIRDNF